MSVKPALIVSTAACLSPAKALLGRAYDPILALDGDLSGLTGPALCWPTADDASIAAMREAATGLLARGCAVKLIQPNGSAPGWNLAAALTDGMTTAQIVAWARAHVEVLEVAPEPGAAPINGFDHHGEEPIDDIAEDRMPYDEMPDDAPGLPPKMEWMPPIDLFDERRSHVFNIEWVPSALHDFVTDQSDLVGADPSIIALSAIVGCAAVIDDAHRVQPKQYDTTWTESARLWGVVVGEPSTKKSPAMSKALNPLRKLDAQLCEQGTAIADKHDLDSKVYRAEEEQWIRKGKKAGEPQPIKPPRPLKPRLIVGNTTVEALADVLVDNRRGVLVVRDELSGWFGQMDVYNAGGSGSKDRAIWLEAYNGGEHPVDRIGRGRFMVPNLSACILGGIQPSAIAEIKSKMSEDGLLQRFMVICPPLARDEHDRVPDARAILAYNAIVQRLYDLNAPGENYTLSPEAAVVRAEVSDRAREILSASPAGGGFASWVGKWDGLFARLLLTFWLIEWAGIGHPPDRVIDRETAVRVRDFIFKCLCPNAITFYLDVLGNIQSVQRTRDVAAYILARGGDYVTTRDLTRGVKQWRRMTPGEQRATLETLQHSGWLVPAPLRENYSRADIKTRYAVNPLAHKTFKDQAEKERSRRILGRKMIEENMSIAPVKPKPAVEPPPA